MEDSISGGLAVRGVSLHVAKTLGYVDSAIKKESSATLMLQQM
jgi:hypothetical protein